jgi:2'-5' RNA ligase
MKFDSTNEKMQRFFIALLPPPAIQTQVTAIKQYFSEVYHSKAALKSPPHVTLQAPFVWDLRNLARLKTELAQFAAQYPAMPMRLDGFRAFAPRVIYIHVDCYPQLLYLQKALTGWMATDFDIIDPQASYRTFTPHMTVAFRDLTPQAFRQAWPEFEQRVIQFEFMANHLSLLIHDGQQWRVDENFALDFI